MEKWRLDRRLAQLREEGTVFECGVDAGADISAATLRSEYQAIVLAGGARVPRGLPVPGAGLAGIYQAMEYLPPANRAVAAARASGGQVGESPISARGRHVVIIGGGDTGADCLGTALRQGAASVTQLEIMPRPPQRRPAGQPWPTYPMIFRVSTAHEEGGERRLRGLDPGVHRRRGRAGQGAAAGRRRPGRRAVHGARGHRARASLRPGPAGHGLLRRRAGRPAGRARHRPGRARERAEGRRATPRRSPAFSSPATWAAGQSLIVWAIAEGRSAAAAADRYLSGETTLPAAIPATAAPLRLSGR